MASRARDIIDTGPAFTQADADALNAQFAGVLLAFSAFETATVTGNVIMDSENGILLFPFGGTFGAKVSQNDFVGYTLAVLGEGLEAPVELSVDGKVVATNTLEHTTPITFPEDESFDVGLDTRTGVTLAEYRYDTPFKFTGEIDKLTFNLAP